MRVNIQTDKGIVKGVFGWPAIHVRDAAKEEPPSLKNIFLDIGAAAFFTAQCRHHTYLVQIWNSPFNAFNNG